MQWKRWVIIAVCLGLIVARIIRPDMQVDVITIWLIVIAAILFVMPELRVVVPYIKRVKIGDTEVELKEQIKELGKEIAQAQDSVANKPGLEVAKDVSSDIDEILKASSINPRLALLRLTPMIQQQMLDRLREAGWDVNRLALADLDYGVTKGVFPKELVSVYRDFLTVRNKVAHDAAFDVDDSTILALVSIGIELLKVFSTKKQADTTT